MLSSGCARGARFGFSAIRHAYRVSPFKAAATFVILLAMTRRPHRSLWLWVAFIAFLATRVSDAHVHLCFDGQEPPTAVHMADGSVHNDAHHADTDHTDQDVDVLGALLVKKVDDSLDLTAPLLAAAIVLLVSDHRSVRPFSAYDSAPAHPPFRLTPPLRGPPR